METVETRCKDELHSLRKVVEVKNQEASYELNFVFWKLKGELRSYFCWHADETGSRCACLRTKFTSTVDKRNCRFGQLSITLRRTLMKEMKLQDEIAAQQESTCRSADSSELRATHSCRGSIEATARH